MPTEGIEPGQRECHDAQKGRLRVDFAYPDARPRPIALEVTAIVDGAYRGGVKASDDAIGRLSALAEKEQWGAWLVAVIAIENVRALEPEIAKVIRDAQPIREKLLASNRGIRPGQYTSDDLMRLPHDEARRAFAAEHKRLKAMGLEEVLPVRAEREHVVGVLPLSGMRVIGSFSEQLDAAIADNAAKLGETVGLDRHLAVLVDRFDAAADPSATPPPTLPAEIDCLWIVHRWRRLEEWQAVWVTRSGDSAWRVHEG